MFHTVNIDLTRLQAQAWGIPYIEAETKGVKEKELDDLQETLAKLDIDGVITGAIASKYQGDRIDRLCSMNWNFTTFTHCGAETERLFLTRCWTRI